MWRPFLSLLVTSYAQLPSVVVPWQDIWRDSGCIAGCIGCRGLLRTLRALLSTTSSGPWPHMSTVREIWTRCFRNYGLCPCFASTEILGHAEDFSINLQCTTLICMKQLDPTINYSVFHHFQYISIFIQPISNLYISRSICTSSQEILQALPDVAAFRDSLQETDLLSALEGAPEEPWTADFTGKNWGGTACLGVWCVKWC